MTRANQIREVLRASAKPMTSREIIAIVPGIRTHHAIGAMYRQGHIDRTGERGDYRYWLAREPISRLKFASEEERRARRNERERIRQAKRRRKDGARPFADMVADRRAAAAKKKAERDAERAKARAEREAMKKPMTEAERLAAKRASNRKSYAKQAAIRKQAREAFLAAEGKKRAKVVAKANAKINAAYNCVVIPRRPQLEDAPKRVVVPETVEEFLARGGVVEVLPGVGEREAA